MPRWEPEAFGRLQEAALELFEERDQEATTVAEIAERPGLTKRTFFHCFRDKREVVSAGSESSEQIVVRDVGTQDASVGALDAVTTDVD